MGQPLCRGVEKKVARRALQNLATSLLPATRLLASVSSMLVNAPDSLD